MQKMRDYEVGYTPTNLRLVLTKLGMTQASLAAVLCVSERALRQWLVEDLNSKSHRDMSLKKWRELMLFLLVVES